MNLVLALAASAALLVVVGLVLSRRRTNSVTIGDLTRAVIEAADAGERAYRAQVDLIGRDRREPVEPTTRGIALARLLCASFPAAAYGVLKAGNDLGSIARSTSISGKEAFQLASGAALKPLNISSEHADFAAIKHDATIAVNEFIGFFNDHFSPDPAIAIPAAEMHLGRQWLKALELSAGEVPASLHSTQFCSSGLHLFFEWVAQLRK